MNEADPVPANNASAGQVVRPPGRLIGLLGLLLGGLALAAPLLPGRLAFLALGLLILIVGLLQNFTGFAVRDPAASGSWFSRGGASILTGLLLLAMPRLIFAALALLLGISWILGGLSTLLAALRQRGQGDWHWQMIDGAVNVVLGLAIALQWPIKGVTSIALYVGLRFISAGWSALMGRIPAPMRDEAVEGLHPDSRLGLPAHAYLGQLREQLTAEAVVTTRSDRAWRWLFLLVFFFIHAARMDSDWNLIGILSPLGAVLGDVGLAIILAYAIIAPLSVSWRSLTRPLERRAWGWYLRRVDADKTGGARAAVTRWWLTRRMRAAVGRQQARGSATAALGWGLQRGLPYIAVLIAVTPLWGVSWFFNTETWVAGAWEVWAEHRTDTWRESMIAAVKEEYGEPAQKPDFLRLKPEGVEEAKDFSFLVIGDTGEGDPSQHILRDQFWLLGQKPEVKFLVLSSDVIYPSGAMKDYEPKFYLPFKGFTKPIYAIPGNHDWYDALEAFSANFLEPKAARAAMRARREVDLNLTTTTERRTDEMIRQAAFLREAYQLNTALQRAPYFEIHAAEFSLIAVDTGIQRRVDDAQMRWLEEALERARGKFKMVILGHPLYAAGHYQAAEEPDFARIHELLKKHSVAVVMAGDTHDFEFYKEPYEAAGTSRSMYHFVNGGGGAYLSIGTALSWPKEPPVAECGFYPRADALISRLDEQTPAWKRPLWWWVKHLQAWPSSPEGVASAFEYDRAPFFQSFMEVRVEGSKNRVRLWLYGANGRLRWRDLHVQGGVPNGQKGEDWVEFSFPLR